MAENAGMINLNELAKEVHENAVYHGWWEEERDFGELIALIHSEVSEVLEEYRNGHELTETYYSKNGKPEGIPSEMADIIIRVLDICGKYELNIDIDLATIEQECAKFEVREKFLKINFKSFGDFIAQLHQAITEWYCEGIYSTEERKNILISVVGFCWLSDIDIEKAIIEKHAFNIIRPYKHGGKVI